MNKGLEILVRNFLEVDEELKSIQKNKNNLVNLINGMNKKIEELASKEMDIASIIKDSGSNICNLIGEYKKEHKHEFGLD